MAKSKQQVATKIGKKKVKVGAKTVTIKPFEDEFKLSEVIRYEINGLDIGALLLKKGSKSRIVFGFSSNGISNIMTNNEIDKFFDPLETGLRDFPENETLTIHQSHFRGNKDREQELRQVIENTEHLELKYFMYSELKCSSNISQKGLRQNVNLDFYVTYTFDEEGQQSKDPIQQCLKKIESSWLKFTGNKEEKENAKLQELLSDGYTEGFERWRNLLNIGMGLDVSPHSAEKIWHKITQRFIDEEIEIPQLLCVTETEGIYLLKNSDLHPVAKIFSKRDVPCADAKWVMNKGQYIAALAMEEKGEGWADKLTQLQTMWKAVCRPEIYDVEVFVQIKLEDPKRIRENMRRLAKQARNDGEEAKEKNDVDVGADLRQQAALEAQKALLENHLPFKTAILFLVHRPNLKQLDRACNNLAAQFQSPIELYREDTITYELWLQTIPIYWNRILSEPFDRTWIYSNAEIEGVMPVVQASSDDKRGIEFISKEGGVPICVDLWGKLRHTLILATSRGGKGILLARIIINHLARGIPVSIMDYPNPDGTGTYTWLAQFLGKDIAAYFNTATESCNIFEIPDLSRYSPEQQEERMTSFKEFLLDILFTMVCGIKGESPGINPDQVRTILSIGIKKFYDLDNLEIKQRFVEAYQAGFDTPEWDNTPVLEDFIASLGPERLQMSNPTKELLGCVEFIRNRLRYWMTGRIGKAISRPSTIKADSLLVVYALANLNNPEDATVMTLAINMQALRKSLEHRVSVMLIDEVSIQVKYNAIAKMIGSFAASGLKNGITLLLAGQDINSIADSPYAANILQNIEVFMIGRLKKTAIDSMVNTLKIDREIISDNASKKFSLDINELATSWLIQADDRLNVTQYYADPITLAASANNPKENEMREEVMAEYMAQSKQENATETTEIDPKYEGLTAFAQKLVASYQDNS